MAAPPKPLLSAQNLQRSYGAHTVLESVAVSVDSGQRIGLVGANGAGKSTLGRILAGVEEADGGELSLRRGARVEYLAQEPRLDPALTVREAVLGGLGEWSEIHARYQRVSGRLASAKDAESAALLAEQEQLADRLEQLGGWERAHQAEAFMQQLNVPDGSRVLGTLSGGERRRADLARVLASEPDLAILDEPTNHLDAETIEWLEQYLIESLPGALILITHDRWVLDRVVTRTLELEAGVLHSYAGGWEAYLEAKAERQATAARTEANRQNFLRRELEWLRRQPKARTGKQKARIDRATKAQSVQGPAKQRDLELGVAATRLGSTILELHDVTLTVLGRELVAGLTLSVTRGKRIGILGKNGSGKTTLLRALLGTLADDGNVQLGGQVVRGKNTSFAYLDQSRANLDLDASILDNVSDGQPNVEWRGNSVSVYTYLDRLRFPREHHHMPVRDLSGGERARVALAKLLLGSANVLVLDEPTNDLDVMTLGALEELLVEFPGVVLVVTHDRYFLDRVATDILHFAGEGRVTHYVGNYQNFLSLRKEAKQPETGLDEAPKPSAASEREAPQRANSKPKKLGYLEQRELDALPDAIETAETRVKELEAVLADPEVYTQRADEVTELVAQLDAARAEAEALLERWETLELKREG